MEKVASGSEMVGTRKTDHATQVLLDELRVVPHCFRDGAENDAVVHQLLLESGVDTDRVKDCVYCYIGEPLLLIQRNAQPFKRLEKLWVHLIQAGLLLLWFWL